MRRVHRQQPVNRCLYLVVMLLALILWSHPVTTAGAERPSVVITRDGALNIRSGAGATYPVIGIAPKNSPLIVHDATGDWYRVQLPNGAEGYAAGKYIHLLPAPAPAADQETEIWSSLPLAVQEELIAVGAEHGWHVEIPAASRVLLSLESRIPWERLAGSANILEISVNDAPVTRAALINKPPIYNFADGRAFDYYRALPTGSGAAWEVFYSPDYKSNNLPGSGYQVLEGQAYLYLFDITPLIQRQRENSLRIRNRGEHVREQVGKPVVLAVRQVKVVHHFVEDDTTEAK